MSKKKPPPSLFRNLPEGLRQISKQQEGLLGQVPLRKDAGDHRAGARDHQLYSAQEVVQARDDAGGGLSGRS